MSANTHPIDISYTIAIAVGITQIISSISLSVLTLIYVILTKRISDASVNSVRHVLLQQRPAVVIRLQPVVMTKAPHAIEFDVLNVGIGPAVSLSVNYVKQAVAMDVVAGAYCSYLTGAANQGASAKIKLGGADGLALPPPVPENETVNLGVIELEYQDIHGEYYHSKCQLYIDEHHNFRERVI